MTNQDVVSPRTVDRTSAIPESPSPLTGGGGSSAAGRDRSILRRLWRPPVLAGLLVSICVLVAGVGYVLSTPVSWSAHRNIVIVPNSTDVTVAASLYDSLSRGQVVATAAELYGESRWHPDTPTVTVVSGNIPPSAVIQVTASGTDRTQVEDTLSTVVEDATPQIDQILSPYQAVVLDSGRSVAHRTGLSHNMMMIIAALAAVLAGAAAGGLVSRLTRQRGQG